MARSWQAARGRVGAAAVAAIALAILTLASDAAPSTAIVPPPTSSPPTVAPRTIVPPRTTAPPRTTLPTTRPPTTPPATEPPATEPPASPPVSAPSPPPPPPQPAPAAPEDDEVSEAPAPPCTRDAVDDFYTAAKDDKLVVPYEAGLGVNDVLGCSGPGYTIDDLTDPPHGTVVKTPNDFGAFEYTPDPGFTGADSFGYTLYQGSAVADQATAHVTVTETCSVVAFSDIYSTAYETPLSEPAPGYLTNDVTECQPFTAIISAAPSDGVLTAGIDGSFVYTPNPGFYHSDSFHYQILDANQAVMAVSEVTVVVDEPVCVAVDDNYSTPADTALSVAAPGVLGNDVVCPDLSSVQLGQSAVFGTVTMPLDGSFTYVPDPGFVGQDSFTYDHWAFDVATLTDVIVATATVMIDVTDAPAVTTTSAPPVATTTITPATTTPPDGPSTTASSGSTTTSADGNAPSTAAPGAAPSIPVPGPATPPHPPDDGFRVATFNASLNRATDGQLVVDLSTPDDQQAANVAAILQHTRPDIVLLNEFDYGADDAAVELFRTNYLLLSQGGAQPIDYPYWFAAPVNTGVPSGFDLDNDGTVGGANDAFGFGDFPGQYGMVLLSRYPIVEDQVRTFQNLLWASVPGARLPDDPATAEPGDWYSPEELAVLRLSSKSHWDVPVDADGRTVHVLAAHPTPPVFDGPEDRNGARNADEIAFWADYVGGTDARWIVDDAGATGGLADGEEFVVVGDLNSDPLDGDSSPGATEQVLALDRVQDPAPASDGAALAALTQRRANDSQAGDPALDTADFDDATAGNLRVDYVLPSDGFAVVDAGVFWPARNDDLAPLVATGDPPASSDHRLVWVDIR